jgi:adenylate kinase
MNIVLLGPPASGKGTQGKKLAEHFDFFYLSSGQLFRELAKTRPEVAKVLDSGELLPDNLVMQFLTEYLESQKRYDNILLDGTPRSVGQYQDLLNWFMQKGSGIGLIIYISITPEEVIRRESARRMDKTTGEIFNLVTNPPGPDVKEENLVQREDDKPEVIKERLEAFEARTQPLVEKLTADGSLVTVNGERSIEEIFTELVSIIEERKNHA